MQLQGRGREDREGLALWMELAQGRVELWRLVQGVVEPCLQTVTYFALLRSELVPKRLTKLMLV
jgi:hypothetical protein